MAVKIFVSHISEEAALAKLFKAKIEESFLSMVDVFVSSDANSIAPGSNWLDKVLEAIRSSEAMLTFCSSRSITRPWINIEAGAGLARRLRIVPICHSGLHPRDLPLPLNVLQGIEASDATQLASLFQFFADKLGSDVPRLDLDALIDEVVKFEKTYSIDIKTYGARLDVSGPHVHTGSDPRRSRWYVRVHNRGASLAENVVMRLSMIDPRPRDPHWGAGYPYPVRGPDKINPNDGENYDLFSSWPNNGDVYIGGIDTKTTAFDNDIRIDPGEMWNLSYELTSANAQRVSFKVEARKDSRQVMLKLV